MFEARVQRAAEALGRKDLAAVMRGWADDGILEFPGTSSIAGRHEGRDAVAAFFGAWFERMTSIEVRVTRVGFSSPTLTFAGTAYMEFETRQTTREGVTFRTQALGVFRYRRGKVVHYREYLFDQGVVDDAWRRADGRQASPARSPADAS